MTSPSRSGQGGPVVTNVIKLCGVLILFVDAFTAPAGIAPETWAGAAFMMAGAQGIESFLGREK